MITRRVVSVLAGLVLSLSGCDEVRSPPAREGPLDDLVAELLPSAERLSGLSATGRVRVERTTPPDVQRYVESRLERFLPAAQLEGMRRSYVMLGLLPDTLDLRGLLLELYGEQVAGFYDPDAQMLYVVDSDAAGPIEPVLVHELVHAIQDQYVDLDSLTMQAGRNDRQTAAQAAIEGHAMLAMYGWLAESMTGDTVNPAALPEPGTTIGASFSGSDAFPVFQRAPRIVRETLLFPYASGASFVQALWRNRAPARTPPFGDFLPLSTEQVMDPRTRFLNDRDEPTELQHGTVEGWSVVYENTLGAFETGILVEEWTGAANGARGWDGDRFTLYESGPDVAMVWTLIWDDATAADLFLERIAGSVRSGPASPSARRIDIEGRPGVQVVLAALASVPPDPAVHCVDAAGRPIRC